MFLYIDIETIAASIRPPLWILWLDEVALRLETGYEHDRVNYDRIGKAERREPKNSRPRSVGIAKKAASSDMRSSLAALGHLHGAAQRSPGRIRILRVFRPKYLTTMGVCTPFMPDSTARFGYRKTNRKSFFGFRPTAQKPRCSAGCKQ